MNKTAVLVIDVQNVYLTGQKWECVSIDRAQSNIKRVCAEGKQGKIVFTRYIPFEKPEGVWKDYNRINAEVNGNVWLNELTDEMKAAARSCGAPIIDKPWYSAWKSEAVRNYLREADTVVVTGVVADCCVLSTVFDLIDAGKYIVYLKDAVSGVSKETEDAVVAVLKGLAYVHLKIMTTDEYLLTVPGRDIRAQFMNWVLSDENGLISISQTIDEFLYQKNFCVQDEKIAIEGLSAYDAAGIGKEKGVALVGKSICNNLRDAKEFAELFNAFCATYFRRNQ